MNANTVALAAGGTLLLSGSAAAHLVGIKHVNLGDIGAGVNTYQISLIFDDPLDQLLAINGDADISSLIFESDAPLVQNNLFEGMQAFDDVPTVADLGGDSWVTIGSPDTHNTAFSPNFLGGDGMESVIKGSYFEQIDNGGYFDENPGTLELPDENMQILIAQFSMDLQQGDRMFYGGTASYNLGGGDLTSEAFQIVIHPAPGTLALLAVGGIVRRRRRDAATVGAGFPAGLPRS